MSSNFNWDMYETIDVKPSTPKVDTVSSQKDVSGINWDSYESIAPPTKAQKFGQDVLEGGKGVLRAGLRGGASLLAAPSKGIGGALEALSTLGTEGQPGEFKGAGTRALRGAGQYLQKLGKEGQEQLKKGIESLLGESYSSGEEALSQFIERAADIYGKGPFKGMAIPAVIGGVAGQTAKELGASENVQQFAELAGLGAKDVIKGISSLAKQPRFAKSGLQLPSIAEKTGEKLKGLKAKVFGGKKESVYKGVSEQAEKLITDIRNKSIPISEEIEKGIDVGTRNQKNLQNVETLANKMTHKIESKGISDYLNNIEDQINFGGVPTGEQKDILKIVDEYKKAYKTDPSGKRFYIPGQYVKQFRNINKDLNQLYETKFIHGQRLETMKFYEGLKGEIEKTLESGTPKEFSNLFKESNKEFSQLKRLDRFNSIMEQVAPAGVIDAKKLNSYFSSPSKSNVLRKQIGKEGFENLKLISNDLSKVQNKLKLIKEIDIADIVKSSATLGLLKFLHIPYAKELVGATKFLQIGRGYLLTSPQGTRDVSNFLKAVNAGSKKSAIRYLQTLDKNMQKYEKEEK